MASSVEQSPFFQKRRNTGAVVVSGTAIALAVHAPPELR
jgi:hypothetical protein